MDAVNPDYLAAHILNPDPQNPVWLLPSAWFPILGGIYHGAQNLFIGIPIFWLLGTNIVSLRIEQAIFGAIIVLLVFCIVKQISKNRLLAAATALFLATDIAFIASFRTQNYIILGGMAWLLLAILPLISEKEESFCRLKLLASGIFFGLAVYGYFVFLFFLPAFAIEILQATPKGRKTHACLAWCLGIVIGLLPYVIGYLSMGIALGGFHQTLVYLRGVTESLAPLSSKLSLAQSYEYAFSMMRLALENSGNELMIFGQTITAGRWTHIKFGIFIASIVLALFWMALRAKKSAIAWSPGVRLIVYLPCSYFLLSGVLGNRLWAHHYSVMTPLFYLVGAVLCYEGYIRLKSSGRESRYKFLKSAVPVLCCVVIAIGNLTQQERFFQQLEETGGKGKMSSSLNLFSEEALSRPSDTVYFFPEWGFFMPFSFLTGDKVPYRLEISKSAIEQLRTKYKYIEVAFWDRKDFDKYNQQLMSLGVESGSLKTYMGRDGKPAFYLLSASL